jgi:chromosome segregation ATPase
MIRSVFALVGLTALLIGLAIWQFGFFSAKVQQVTTQIERETAVARAESMIRDTERRADDLSQKAQKLRVEARAKEIAASREVENLDKTRAATAALATAAREAGLPKPSVAQEEHRKQTLAFAGRTLTGEEVYRTLDRWQGEWNRGDGKRQVTEKIITRMRTAADQLEAKQQRLATSINDVRGKLEDLQMQRDLARVEKELSELGASVRGEFAGDVGQALQTLQKEIDELQATTDVVGSTAGENAPLTPDEVLTGPAQKATGRQQLDALWDVPPKADR